MNVSDDREFRKTTKSTTRRNGRHRHRDTSINALAVCFPLYIGIHDAHGEMGQLVAVSGEGRYSGGSIYREPPLSHGSQSVFRATHQSELAVMGQQIRGMVNSVRQSLDTGATEHLMPSLTTDGALMIGQV
ncbi:hypothetical protein HS088_TW08G00092 [Tripterygium wilfordii]|uniref:Uncharacterized protein n=1 Tax=Tripterygium wilfordii TaxID=458696 RepID=A0A7J7DB71_TRIWF|nr:hypothetical protein HS088_TW08G00092 [Tripterygium wilfordii]